MNGRIGEGTPKALPARPAAPPAPATAARTAPLFADQATFVVPRAPQTDALRTFDATPVTTLPDFSTAPVPVVPGEPALGRVAQILAAQTWLPGKAGVLSGTEANAILTDDYQRLDRAFQGYMGGAGGVPNWMTFGKYAAREAGQQIARLENAERLLDQLDADAGIDAVVDGLRNLDDLYGPGGALAAEELTAYVKREGVMGTTLGFVAKARLDVATLRGALVKGNTEIHANIAPAYDGFLAAERAGGDGLAALAQMGYGAAPLDPQGFVLQAFTRYKAAHELEQPIADLTRQLAVAPRGVARDALGKKLDGLTAQQRELATAGNLLIGCQEQMVILQQGAVFGNPEVKRMVGAMGGTMLLHGADDDHFALLPGGGDWTDFATRMGLTPVAADAPGAIAVRDPAPGGGFVDQPTYYLPKPPAARAGTIYTLFTDRGGGPEARKLMAGAPPPLPFQPAGDGR